jgi:hypothetical protein
MATNTSGVGRFFGGLAAGPALRQRAATQGRLDAMREALSDAQIRNTGAEADLRQDKLAALDPATLSQAFAGFGLQPDQASGAGTLVRSGQNVNEIGQLMKSLAAQSAQRAARDRAINGDLNGANAELFGVANGPQKLSAVEGGVTLNPLATPDQNQFAPTAVGQAMIAADQARANASNASAARSRAGIAADKASNYETIDTGNGLVRHNKLTNEVMPITDADGTQISKVTKVTPTAAPANVAQSILGSELNAAGLPVTNPDANQMFLAWQARMAAIDPRYQNGEYALSQYALQQPAGAILAGRDENGRVAPQVVEPAGISKEFSDAIANKPTAPNGASPAEQGGSQNPSSQLRETTAAETDPGEVKPATTQAVRVNSAAERDALPDGTTYIAPDGSVRIKRAKAGAR